MTEICENIKDQLSEIEGWKYSVSYGSEIFTKTIYGKEFKKFLFFKKRKKFTVMATVNTDNYKTTFINDIEFNELNDIIDHKSIIKYHQKLNQIIQQESQKSYQAHKNKIIKDMC